MYVKRLPMGGTSFGPGNRPNAEEVLQANKANAHSVDRMLNAAAGYDTRNFYRGTNSTGGTIPLVDFGDPRSLT
jgi:hypothetical protein